MANILQLVARILVHFAGILHLVARILVNLSKIQHVGKTNQE